ncbi:hypothetical protein [Acidipropionibacterium jensenii]|uniref:Uncharacterized protein n=1 Tax=Acidipropionibacterium jensenii TaxID=1749 RepID=A0A3S4WWP3_9ACTN|nr:hypothetical protein [Acidipropionibacterium jensenii]MDN5978459.1 hypothetical protein [Acidipropionibacterium jensenii]MDN5996612.1 hypothetical protein [Acidipropionibacterium jensenii]MDN6021391.1 hypothetical protein [Acidipropionibacterium jensenii]MDN6426930.1 hypothetical protein [Acidipropionibacterium jensenii]MDN6441431.1 hypothetical protein [Acidipropionibacterium jensenii]
MVVTVVGTIIGIGLAVLAAWSQIGDMFHREYPRQNRSDAIEKSGPDSHRTE